VIATAFDSPRHVSFAPPFSRQRARFGFQPLMLYRAQLVKEVQCIGLDTRTGGHKKRAPGLEE